MGPVEDHGFHKSSLELFPAFDAPDAGAYDVAGLGDIGSVRRVLEIAVLDALGLDNSVARSRVLIGAAGAAAKLLEAEREEGWG